MGRFFVQFLGPSRNLRTLSSPAIQALYSSHNSGIGLTSISIEDFKSGCPPIINTSDPGTVCFSTNMMVLFRSPGWGLGVVTVGPFPVVVPSVGEGVLPWSAHSTLTVWSLYHWPFRWYLHTWFLAPYDNKDRKKIIFTLGVKYQFIYSTNIQSPRTQIDAFQTNIFYNLMTF